MRAIRVGTARTTDGRDVILLAIPGGRILPLIQKPNERSRRKALRKALK